jgi:hypothetical protein
LLLATITLTFSVAVACEFVTSNYRRPAIWWNRLASRQ